MFWVVRVVLVSSFVGNPVYKCNLELNNKRLVDDYVSHVCDVILA